MNKNDLINVLSKHTLTKNDAKKFINIIFDTIRDRLLSGEKVVIQHFGTFIPKFHKSKRMYNPKQKRYVVLTPRKRIKFILSKKFSAILNLKDKNK